jgi:hemerythrin-like metal-binding protein
MKLSTSKYITRSISGMMTQARRTTSLQMERLAHTADEQFADGFNELVADLEMSFRDEEAAMEALNYPALRSHREQHARALSALHHAQPQVEGGDIALGREALELLPKWLMLHRSTMDLALASTGRPAADSALWHQGVSHAWRAPQRAPFHRGHARV